ncbi:MAG: Fe-S-containing hydro-lyase [Candidatus Aminicenantes bacterium]|nr:Fe-S-containing hydro-lyase [Candidatus Aminicenantes bacterium]MBL7083095.1 Fe-S-containing hydro-lyase [Candidatus Aminicenantes bacterium]
MAEHRIETPVSDELITNLRAGDKVFITGYLYTGRDSAHKKLIDLVNEGKELPIDVKGQFIYYVGPTPARPGKPIGSAGPTTSYRMDSFAPTLHALGLKGTIGKGSRNEEVKESLKKYKAVYLAAVGGAGALISKSIEGAEVIAYSELGPEAIRKVEVKDFPCIVINDMYGGDLYEEGKKQYKRD